MTRENKKTTYKKLFLKSQQKVELLIANPKFQEEMQKLRKIWNIPRGGLKTNKESEEWHGRLYKKNNEYITSNKGFRRAIKEIRERKEKLRERGNKDSYGKIMEDNKKIQSEIPVNALRRDLINLRIKFELSSWWEDFLKYYLLFNEVKILGGGFNIQIKINEDTEEDELYIRIYELTTIEDIIMGWNKIQMFQKRLPGYKKGRFKEIKKLQRNKRILELSKQGFKDKEIVKKINEEFEESLIYYDIPKIRHQFKKKIHRP